MGGVAYCNDNFAALYISVMIDVMIVVMIVRKYQHASILSAELQPSEPRAANEAATSDGDRIDAAMDTPPPWHTEAPSASIDKMGKRQMRDKEPK